MSAVWTPSPKGKPITVVWTCGACGHRATFGPDETVYEDDARYCEHGPKAPRYPDGTLIYGPHTSDAIYGHYSDAAGGGLV